MLVYQGTRRPKLVLSSPSTCPELRPLSSTKNRGLSSTPRLMFAQMGGCVGAKIRHS
jgi:hypothetical protein